MPIPGEKFENTGNRGSTGTPETGEKDVRKGFFRPSQNSLTPYCMEGHSLSSST